MNKSDRITLIASLPDDDPRNSRVDAILSGMQADASEELFTLRELGVHPKIRLDPTFLWKLGIKSVSESFVGGRPRYRLSAALAYLKSSECERRRNELREARRKREQTKTAGAA